jgi:hypothetical protein
LKVKILSEEFQGISAYRRDSVYDVVEEIRERLRSVTGKVRCKIAREVRVRATSRLYTKRFGKSVAT